MSNRVITIVAAAGLLGAGGFAAKYLLPAAAGPAPAQATSVQDTPYPKVAYLDLKEMTLRLSDTNAEHYIKLTPVVAVRARSADDITDRTPVLRDRIVDAVASCDSVTLASAAGKAKLKHQILAAFTKDFHDDVVDLYFSEYLVE